MGADTGCTGRKESPTVGPDVTTRRALGGGIGGPPGKEGKGGENVRKQQRLVPSKQVKCAWGKRCQGDEVGEQGVGVRTLQQRGRASITA